jgi:hypothetical protein
MSEVLVHAGICSRWYKRAPVSIDSEKAGGILMLDFLEPLGVTQHRLAVSIGVPPRRIDEMAHGKRRISAETTSDWLCPSRTTAVMTR